MKIEKKVKLNKQQQHGGGSNSISRDPKLQPIVPAAFPRRTQYNKQVVILSLKKRESANVQKNKKKLVEKGS